ncbi:MAG: hypothetical protein ABIO45_01140 [Burkholderiaceae bacterium]
MVEIRGVTALSFGVADAVDDPGVVVRDEDRAVSCLQHVGRPPPQRRLAFLVLEKTVNKGVLGRVAARVKADTDHVVALLGHAVPRALLRDQHAVAVLGREHVAGIELEAHRRDVRPEIERRWCVLVARLALGMVMFCGEPILK